MMAFTLIGVVIYLSGIINSAFWLYAFCLWMGLGIGYWAMFVTIGAEQFGTNLRATAATTIPNMVRGTVVLMTTAFGSLKLSFSVLGAGALVGIVCFIIGFISITTLQETHNRDLDFLEE